METFFFSQKIQMDGRPVSEVDFFPALFPAGLEVYMAPVADIQPHRRLFFRFQNMYRLQVLIAAVDTADTRARHIVWQPSQTR